MKPKQLLFYETSDGTPVKTLDDWKRAELCSTLNGWMNEQKFTLPAESINAIVSSMIMDGGVLSLILSATERGRPNGAKDKKPRVKKMAPPTIVPPAA